MDTIELVEPGEIVAVADITNATCSENTNDGAIVLTVSGGSGNFTYNWSSGDTTRDLTNIGAGQYQVTITDENLCTANFSYDVTAAYTATCVCRC